MRVIAGKLGGRIFSSPGSRATHPMSDRMRGGLFNILGDLEGLIVLDAFAGSGALAFEAVSRGAQRVTAIEADKAAQAIIAENITTLGVEDAVYLIRANTNAWLQTNPDTRFDIVLCDPPYNRLQEDLIDKLVTRITEKGIVVISWPGKREGPRLQGLTLHMQRSYGDAQLFFFVR